MRITVFFHGILSDWVGIPQAEIDLPEEGTLLDLLAEIGQTHGHNMPEQLWNEEQNAFHKAVWAMRGQEKLVDPTAGLKNGEKVRFFLRLDGG